MPTHETDPRVEPVGRDKRPRGSRSLDPRHDLYLTGHAGRVGAGLEVFEIPRVRSGQVIKRILNLKGRVGSGQEVVQSHGSSRVESVVFPKSRGLGRVRSRHLKHFVVRIGPADQTPTDLNSKV